VLVENVILEGGVENVIYLNFPLAQYTNKIIYKTKTNLWENKPGNKTLTKANKSYKRKRTRHIVPKLKNIRVATLSCEQIYLPNHNARR